MQCLLCVISVKSVDEVHASVSCHGTRINQFLLLLNTIDLGLSFEPANATLIVHVFRHQCLSKVYKSKLINQSQLNHTATKRAL